MLSCLKTYIEEYTVNIFKIMIGWRLKKIPTLIPHPPFPVGSKTARVEDKD